MTIERDEHEAHCILCGGPLVELGVLGATMHYRCRACGAGSSEYQPPAWVIRAAMRPVCRKGHEHGTPALVDLCDAMPPVCECVSCAPGRCATSCRHPNCAPGAQ